MNTIRTWFATQLVSVARLGLWNRDMRYYVAANLCSLSAMVSVIFLSGSVAQFVPFGNWGTLYVHGPLFAIVWWLYYRLSEDTKLIRSIERELDALATGKRRAVVWSHFAIAFFSPHIAILMFYLAATRD